MIPEVAAVDMVWLTVATVMVVFFGSGQERGRWPRLYRLSWLLWWYVLVELFLHAQMEAVAAKLMTRFL